MAVTIKEIAEKMGVSRGTVDRALHNRKGINPVVAQQIQYAAENMGYYPDKAGKILVAKKNPILIGCMVPSIGNDFFKDVIDGFRREGTELSDFGISVIIKEIKGYDEATHINGINELLEQNVSALCLSTIDVPKVQNLVNKIVDSGIPVVAVNTDITNTKRICYVGSDYIKGGRTAAGMLSLITKKNMNILIATGSYVMKGHSQRIEGFKKTLKKTQVKYKIIDVMETQDNDSIAYEKALEILQKHPCIDSIYIVAAGVVGVCRAVMELGRQDDIIIMAFDDIPSTAELIDQGVIRFTICQEPAIQGGKSINILFNYFMNNKKIKPKSSFTKTVIKIKENL